MAMISNKQWSNICLDMIGLRSGADGNDLDGASYAMDCGVKVGPKLPPVPDNWDDLLMGTVNTVLAHENSAERYLMLVTKSSATGESYAGTFPKCSSKPTAVLEAVAMAPPMNEAELVAWVVEHIPGGS